MRCVNLPQVKCKPNFIFYSVNRPVSKLAYCNFLKLLYSTYVFVAEDVLNDINAVISAP